MNRMKSRYIVLTINHHITEDLWRSQLTLDHMRLFKGKTLKHWLEAPARRRGLGTDVPRAG